MILLVAAPPEATILVGGLRGRMEKAFEVV
jgi:hypothetical protein